MEATGLAALRPLHLLAPSAKHRPGPHPHEAVARPLLAALDGLEEKRGAAVVQAAEQGEGRIHVGENLADHGNQVAPGGQALEFILRGANGHSLVWRGPRRRRKAQ